jgi:hypothetical protein
MESERTRGCDDKLSTRGFALEEVEESTADQGVKASGSSLEFTCSPVHLLK